MAKRRYQSHHVATAESESAHNRPHRAARVSKPDSRFPTAAATSRTANGSSEVCEPRLADIVLRGCYSRGTELTPERYAVSACFYALDCSENNSGVESRSGATCAGEAQPHHMNSASLFSHHCGGRSSAHAEFCTIFAHASRQKDLASNSVVSASLLRHIESGLVS